MNHPGGAENIINQIEPETVILYDVNAWWWWFDRSRLYKGTWPRIDYLGFWYLTWLLPCGSGGYVYGCTSFGGPRHNACLESPSWLLWWLLCGS